MSSATIENRKEHGDSVKKAIRIPGVKYPKPEEFTTILNGLSQDEEALRVAEEALATREEANRRPFNLADAEAWARMLNPELADA